MPEETLSAPLYRVEEERLPEVERPREPPGYRIEDENVAIIKFEGAALQDLLKLKGNLKNAKDIKDVVRIALEILALAENKEIIIEGGGKRWRIKDLWRT